MAHLSTFDWMVLSGRGADPSLPTTANHPVSLSVAPVVIDAMQHADTGGELVTELMYGGFIEHLGRCIYGGIVDDPKAPSPSRLLEQQPNHAPAWRADIRRVIARDGELEIPIMRWPGGSYACDYHWQNGIGPAEERKAAWDPAWGRSESNRFGTDEFIAMCRAYGWEPFLCLNMGTGTFEEALAWLEYCNGTENTYWANLRRKNTGRDEPHNVKYWGLGNETFGPWTIGQLTATEYAQMAKRWALSMKMYDPTIKLSSCGENGWSDWDRAVLQVLIPHVDFHTIHFYTAMHGGKPSGYEYEKNVFGAAAPERGIQVCKSLIDLYNIDNTWRQIPANSVKISYDEWGVWDNRKANAKNGLQQTYDLTDALGLAGWLHAFLRNHTSIGIACYAQTVNVLSPIITRPDGILFQPNYYPLKFFAKYMKNGHTLQVPSLPDRYDGPTYPDFIQQLGLRPRYVDIVSMVIQKEGRVSVRLSVINRHPSADWEAPLVLAGLKLESVVVHELYHDDISAINTFEDPNNVAPVATTFSAAEWEKHRSVVRKHSWQFIVAEGTAE